MRRSVVERLSFEQGWGVEVGLLIDVARSCGVEAVGQLGIDSVQVLLEFLERLLGVTHLRLQLVLFR